jgi:formate/nitrite transporter FocA (FNT family)
MPDPTQEGIGPTMLLPLTTLLAPSLSRVTAWTSRVTATLAMASVAVLWCVLGLVGSGFDYSVASATAASEDLVIDAPDVLAWSSMLGNMIWAALASVAAGITVLALGLWITPSAEERAETPQRHSFDVYDAAD